VLELSSRPPLLHRFAFAFANNGWRGSQHLWKVAYRAQKVQDGESIKLSNGFPIFIDSNDWISKTIYEGTYERALLSFLIGLELTDLYIDVGANIGVTFWHSMRSSKSTATFMVFEPSAQCFRGLDNTRMDIGNYGQIFKYAIGDVDGKAILFGLDNEAHSGAASLAKHPGLRDNQIEVQVHKLDTILEASIINKTISLLKIDTEGFEAQVVDGARKILQSGKIEILVMEVSPNFGSVDYLTVVDKLLRGNYLWFSLEEGGKLRKTPYLQEVDLLQALKYSHQWNLVLIRRDVFAKYEKSQNRIRIASMSTN
jgi:FkbM family methyltransferase